MPNTDKQIKAETRRIIRQVFVENPMFTSLDDLKVQVFKACRNKDPETRYQITMLASSISFLSNMGVSVYLMLDPKRRPIA